MISTYVVLLYVFLVTWRPSAVAGVRVGAAVCNTTIPIPSQYILDPAWSLAAYQNRAEEYSDGGLSFDEVSVSDSVKQRIVMESGMRVGSVVLFETAPSTQDLVGQPCSLLLDPLKAAMDGVVSNGAHLTLLQVTNSSIGVCSFPISISLTEVASNSTVKIRVEELANLFSPSMGIAMGGLNWPLRFTSDSNCTIRFMLLVNQYGALDPWYVWIPTTVYSAFVTILLLPAVFFRRQLPSGLLGIFLFLVFFGFFGSCIGLAVEILQWQSVMGTIFPFPGSVTLYCCLAILYTLYFIPLIYQQECGSVLFMGVLRLLVYGINCALCVCYWIAGYIILGSLALLQFLVTNIIVTYYYAYVTVHMRRRTGSSTLAPKFSGNFVYLWCAPITPFACCALMYYDVYLLSRQEVCKSLAVDRVRDIIRVYNTQMSIPLLFFQNIFGTALLAAATAFHMPFLILLFASLFLGGLHLIHTVIQYLREWRRWRSAGVLGDSVFSSLSLSPVMTALFSQHCSSESMTFFPSNAPPSEVYTSPRQHSLRRTEVDVQEGGAAAYRASSMQSQYSQSSEGSRIVFPPFPVTQYPRSRGGGSYGNSADDAFATPLRHSASDALEFWPDSVER